jgi:hypothetical protein
MYSSFSAGKVSEAIRGNKRKSKAEKSRGEDTLAEGLPDRPIISSNRR